LEAGTAFLEAIFLLIYVNRLNEEKIETQKSKEVVKVFELKESLPVGDTGRCLGALEGDVGESSAKE